MMSINVSGRMLYWHYFECLQSWVSFQCVMFLAQALCSKKKWMADGWKGSDEPSTSNWESSNDTSNPAAIPSAPPSYEESMMYPDVSNLLPPFNPVPSSGSRSAFPFELMGGTPANTSSQVPPGPHIHWGVVGFYQPVQPQDAIQTSDPYIVLLFPEDVIPKVTPNQKLSLPFLQRFVFGCICASRVH